MVFLWRGDPRFGPGQDAAMFLPVELKSAETPSIPEPARAGGAGEIEIALASGHQLHRLAALIAGEMFGGMWEA